MINKSINIEMHAFSSIWLQNYSTLMGHVNKTPTMQFSLEFPEILSQNHICYHWLSVCGISKIMHCGILINMPWLKKLWKENLGIRTVENLTQLSDITDLMALQVIGITGFDKTERRILKSLTEMIGASFTSYLARSNTALVCKR